MTESKKSKRGLASMSIEQRKWIASQGGKAAQAKGAAHTFTDEERKAGGRKAAQALHDLGLAHQFDHEEAVVAGHKGWQSLQDKRISRLSGRDLSPSVRKTLYTVDDLCKRMEVSEPTFYKIIRSPGANFPKPLNAAPHAGVTVWYPADECDLWLANNEIGTLAPRKGKRGRTEDTFLAASMGDATVGSVLEFHTLAGSAAIRELLVSHTSEVRVRHYPSYRFLMAEGWRTGYAR